MFAITITLPKDAERWQADMAVGAMPRWGPDGSGHALYVVSSQDVPKAMPRLWGALIAAKSTPIFLPGRAVFRVAEWYGEIKGGRQPVLVPFPLLPGGEEMENPVESLNRMAGDPPTIDGANAVMAALAARLASSELADVWEAAAALAQAAEVPHT